MSAMSSSVVVDRMGTLPSGTSGHGCSRHAGSVSDRDPRRLLWVTRSVNLDVRSRVPFAGELPSNRPTPRPTPPGRRRPGRGRRARAPPISSPVDEVDGDRHDPRAGAHRCRRRPRVTCAGHGPPAGGSSARAPFPGARRPAGTARRSTPRPLARPAMASSLRWHSASKGQLAGRGWRTPRRRGHRGSDRPARARARRGRRRRHVGLLGEANERGRVVHLGPQVVEEGGHRAQRLLVGGDADHRHRIDAGLRGAPASSEGRRAPGRRALSSACSSARRAPPPAARVC